MNKQDLTSQADLPSPMTVDSFSQLPFTRPAIQNPSKSINSNPVRLFGFDFPSEPNNSNPKIQEDAIITRETANENPSATQVNRKFECHYCCRNFPTSQALGGHQNAHKRERQHAKRAHMAATQDQYSYPNFVSEGHIYGLINYHRLGAAAPPQQLPSHYPSFSGARFYGGPGSVLQPITGSPVQRVLRVPNYGSTITSFGSVQRENYSSQMLPLFKGGEFKGVNEKETRIGSDFISSSSSTSSSASPKERGGFACTGGGKDGLSLDLHL